MSSGSQAEERGSSLEFTKETHVSHSNRKSTRSVGGVSVTRATPLQLITNALEHAQQRKDSGVAARARAVAGRCPAYIHLRWRLRTRALDSRHGRREQRSDNSGRRSGGFIAGRLPRATGGLRVHLHESRSDIRRAAEVSGRSINLALSRHGREALRAVGLEDEVLSTAIPMRARMIHPLSGNQ